MALLIQNKILKGTPTPDNPVTLTIDLSDFDPPLTLSSFDKIVAKFGADERNSIDNAASVLVVDDDLELRFNDTEETENNFWYIYGIIGTKITVLTSECIGDIEETIICSQ